jgi:peptidoglycan/LPS O-acetylase OafA/YrhL
VEWSASAPLRRRPETVDREYFAIPAKLYMPASLAARKMILSSKSGTHGRDLGLDIARATAITMVLIVHGITVAGVPFFGEFFTGVDLFFVLSGFLIGRIYFVASARAQFHLFDFWRSRWWRTLPPYYAVLAGFCLKSRPLPFYYWIFAQNYVGVTGFVPSWSLCVEEHFYLVLPLIGIAVTRLTGRRSFLYWLPIAFFAPFAFRMLTLAWFGTMSEDWAFRTHFHCEGLVMGVWLAYLNVDHPRLFARVRRSAICLTPFVPLLLTFVPLWHKRPLGIDLLLPTAYAIGYGAWVCVLYGIGDWRSLVFGGIAEKAVRALALYSYSLYLTHTDIGIWARSHLNEFHRGPVKTMIVFGVELAAGAVFYFLFELPSIKTRDWFRARHLRIMKQATESHEV